MYFLLRSFEFYLYRFMFFLLFWFQSLYFSVNFCFSYYFRSTNLSISLLFLLIWTIFLLFLTVFTSTKFIFIYVGFKFYLIMMFFLLMMFFKVRTILLFFFLFEARIIPIFFIVIIVGYTFNRYQAAIYIFLYTFLNSFFFLIMVFYLLFELDENFMLIFFNCSDLIISQSLIVLRLLVFFVKLPIFLVHLWLPKAHVDAPLVGSIILAAILLKIGGYGVFKFIGILIYLFNCILKDLAFFRVLGGLYICFICMRQSDLKKQVAYSSVVHMRPVLCSLMVLRYEGLLGSFIIMISHGLCSSGLFFLLNIIYVNILSRSVIVRRGCLMWQPVLFFWWFIFCIFNFRVPPTFNFFSELFLLVGSLWFNLGVMAFFFLIMLLVGFYSIIIFSYLNHGSFLVLVCYTPLLLVDILIVFIHLYPLIFFFFYYYFIF